MGVQGKRASMKASSVGESADQSGVKGKAEKWPDMQKQGP